MNTLKITDINRPLTERHDLERAKITEVEILGKKCKIYNPCNLNLVIDRKCNCDCFFCFFRGEAVRKRITDEEYRTKLDSVFRDLEGLPVEITITGGEPTLCQERLIPVMEMIKRYGFPNRTFSTNGTGLLRRIEGKPLLQYMKENNCVYNVSLSRMSADDNENRKIFGGNTIGNKEIRQAAVFAEVNDMDIRLSCNLLKNGVGDWDGIKGYMAFYEALGITSFLFRKIVPKQKSISVSGSAVEGKRARFPVSAAENEGEAVPVSDIVAKMKKEQGIRLLKTAHGSMYDVDIYGYGQKLIKHYRGKTYTAEKGCERRVSVHGEERPQVSSKEYVGEERKLVTSLIYEEGGLRTAW